MYMLHTNYLIFKFPTFKTSCICALECQAISGWFYILALDMSPSFVQLLLLPSAYVQVSKCPNVQVSNARLSVPDNGQCGRGLAQPNGYLAASRARIQPRSPVPLPVSQGLRRIVATKRPVKCAQQLANNIQQYPAISNNGSTKRPTANTKSNKSPTVETK